MIQSMANETVSPVIQDVLGHLNFSSGTPDVRFYAAMNRLFQFCAAKELATATTADVATGTTGTPKKAKTPKEVTADQIARGQYFDTTLKLPKYLYKIVLATLRESLKILSQSTETFRSSQQAESILKIVDDHLLTSYRQFHSDILFHQDEDTLFNSFSLARAFEVVLQQGEPWDETDRIVADTIDQLNDYIGYRPVPVLEGREKHEPHPHEFVAAVPLYIKGAGVAFGRYQPIVENALKILETTDEDTLHAAFLDPERIQELILDPRAYDFDHPVNRKPNYHFGLWDPQSFDIEGCYNRFVVHQVTLDGIVQRLTTAYMGESEVATTPSAELLAESGAILAGTMLMGSGVCGESPHTHDSSTNLGTLMPIIAEYRDRFYEDLLSYQTGPMLERLTQEKKRMQQPFAGARQDLNKRLSKRRADQLQRLHLSRTFARMGYFDAAMRQTKIVQVTSSRLLCRIDCMITESHFLADRKKLVEAAAILTQIEELLHRGIDCGAIVDPWCIIGFGAQYSLFHAVENSIHDHRIDDLIGMLDDIFDLYSRLQKDAAATGNGDLQADLSDRMSNLASWWDQFGSTDVSSVEGFSGSEAWESAAVVATALAAWHQAGTGAGDVAFWRRHVTRFKSPKAYVLLGEALLEQRDPVASMALMMQWLSQSEDIPLIEADYSFHSIAIRWMEMVYRDKNFTDSDDDSDNKNTAKNNDSDDTNDFKAGEDGFVPIPTDERWKLVKKFFDFLEANADYYWTVPAIKLPPSMFAKDSHSQSRSPSKYSNRGGRGKGKNKGLENGRDSDHDTEKKKGKGKEPKKIAGDEDEREKNKNKDNGKGRGQDRYEEHGKVGRRNTPPDDLDDDNFDEFDDRSEYLEYDDFPVDDFDDQDDDFPENDLAERVAIDSIYSAAYENMTFQDSAADGVDDNLMEAPGSFRRNEEDFELIAETERISGRLAFLATVAKLWKFATLKSPLVTTFSDSAPDSVPDSTPNFATAQEITSETVDDAKTHVQQWLSQAEIYWTELLKLLDKTSRYIVPPARGTQESLMDYDRHRGTKEILIDRIVWAAVEIADTKLVLQAVLDIHADNEIAADGGDTSGTGSMSSNRGNKSAAMEEYLTLLERRTRPTTPSEMKKIAARIRVLSKKIDQENDPTQWENTSQPLAEPLQRWQPAAREVLTAVFKHDVDTVKKLWPFLLKKFEPETLLYVPTSRGGDAIDIVYCRCLQQVVLRMLEVAPRLGLLPQEYQLLESVKKMERLRAPRYGSITEFDRIVEVATRAITRCVAESSKTWNLAEIQQYFKEHGYGGMMGERFIEDDESDIDRSDDRENNEEDDIEEDEAEDNDNEDNGDGGGVNSGALFPASKQRGGRSVEQAMVDSIEMMIERLLECWLSHSRQIRISPVESLSDRHVWNEVKTFIQKYGKDLFTQQFMGFGNLRAILHQGLEHYLQSLVRNWKVDGDEPEVGKTMVEAITSGQYGMKEAIFCLEIIFESIAESYSEYIDYNSTTTHSDRGEKLYMLLDILRVLTGYERISWNLKPVYWVHDGMIRADCHTAATLWERAVGKRSLSVAEDNIRQYERLSEKYGMWLPSIHERLCERFVRPLQIDRMCGYVAPAMREAREDSSEKPAFAELEKQIELFAREPLGVGFEMPEWLSSLQDEVLSPRASESAQLDETFHTGTVSIPQRIISYTELRKQLKQIEAVTSRR